MTATKKEMNKFFLNNIRAPNNKTIMKSLILKVKIQITYYININCKINKVNF